LVLDNNKSAIYTKKMSVTFNIVPIETQDSLTNTNLGGGDTPPSRLESREVSRVCSLFMLVAISIALPASRVAFWEASVHVIAHGAAFRMRNSLKHTALR
jgi:hypothetical protein